MWRRGAFDPSRHRRHNRRDDPGAQGAGHRGAAGAAGHGHDGHHGGDSEPTEVREQNFSGVCLHLLHRPHDHLPGLARLLLHPEVPLRQRPRPEPGRA